VAGRRIAAAAARREGGRMKPIRHLPGVVVVYLVAAAAYLALDLFGATSAFGWSWVVLPAVLAQALVLAVVVGTWTNALVFFETEEDARTPRDAEAAIAAAGRA
jgi:hypothetical protein